MTACLVAEREPYGSYGRSRGAEASLDLVVSGDARSLPRAELYVLPAAAFLSLPPALRPVPCFAYGPESLMASAFRGGCADYLREPWGEAELEARASRLETLRFGPPGAGLSLEGAVLRGPSGSLVLGEEERGALRLLVLGGDRPVAREAFALALWGGERGPSRALDVLVSSLRKRLKSVSPGAERALVACRGRGYRFLHDACG